MPLDWYFADWLEEHGEGERAQFIRYVVQYPHCEIVELTKKDPFPLLGIKPLQAVDINHADYTKCQPDFRTWMFGESEQMGSVIHDLTRDLDYRCDRGFIQQIRGTLSDWLQHGPTICREHPVQSVRITDKVPTIYVGRDNWGWERARNLKRSAGRLLNPSVLPQEIFDLLDPVNVRAYASYSLIRYADRYPSQEAAHADLSQACIQWAKAQDPKQSVSSTC